MIRIFPILTLALAFLVECSGRELSAELATAVGLAGSLDPSHIGEAQYKQLIAEIEKDPGRTNRALLAALDKMADDDMILQIRLIGVARLAMSDPVGSSAVLAKYHEKVRARLPAGRATANIGARGLLVERARENMELAEEYWDKLERENPAQNLVPIKGRDLDDADLDLRDAVYRLVGRTSHPERCGAVVQKHPAEANAIALRDLERTDSEQWISQYLAHMLVRYSNSDAEGARMVLQRTIEICDRVTKKAEEKFARTGDRFDRDMIEYLKLMESLFREELQKLDQRPPAGTTIVSPTPKATSAPAKGETMAPNGRHWFPIAGGIATLGLLLFLIWRRLKRTA